MGDLSHADVYGIALHWRVRRDVVTRANGDLEREVLASELVTTSLSSVGVTVSVRVPDNDVPLAAAPMSSTRSFASAFRSARPGASEALCDNRDIQGVLGSRRLRRPDAFGWSACTRSRFRNHAGRATLHSRDAEASPQPHSVRPLLEPREEAWRMAVFGRERCGEHWE